VRIDGSRLFVPGSDARLAALAFDDQSRVSSAIGAAWSTSDSSVASVTVDGIVTGGRPGLATITAVTPRGVVQATVTTRSLPGRVAFARDHQRIALMTLDGTEPTELAGYALAGPASLALSPSGNLIAFDGLRGVTWGPVRGGALHALDLVYEAPSSDLSWPSWIGSDDYLAVKLRSSELASAQLSTQLANTWGPLQLSVDRPRVAPGGNTFMFECQSDLCEAGSFASFEYVRNASRGAFSPDGYQISYDTPSGVCVAASTFPTCNLVLAHGSSEVVESTWSPDGKYLLLIRGAEIWVMEPNGDNAVRLPLATRGGGSPSSPSWAAVGSP
jgi:hypothetical protein